MPLLFANMKSNVLFSRICFRLTDISTTLICGFLFSEDDRSYLWTNRNRSGIEKTEILLFFVLFDALHMEPVHASYWNQRLGTLLVWNTYSTSWRRMARNICNVMMVVCRTYWFCHHPTDENCARFTLLRIKSLSENQQYDNGALNLVG